MGVARVHRLGGMPGELHPQLFRDTGVGVLFPSPEVTDPETAGFAEGGTILQ